MLKVGNFQIWCVTENVNQIFIRIQSVFFGRFNYAEYNSTSGSPRIVLWLLVFPVLRVSDNVCSFRQKSFAQIYYPTLSTPVAIPAAA